MDVVVYDEEDRRYVPALLMLLLVAGAALLAATVTYLVLYNPSSTTTAVSPGPAALVPAAPSSPSGTTPPLGVSDPQAGTTGDACTQAFAKADAALSRAVHLDRELAAHTKVLDDLLAKRTDAAGVLHQSLPILTEATTDRLRFAEERTAYQDARKGCTAAGG